MSAARAGLASPSVDTGRRDLARRDPVHPDLGRLDLGVGIGWRPQIAHVVAGLEGLRFVEVVAESLHGEPRRGRGRDEVEVPPALAALRDRGVAVVPHGVRLSLGGAEPPDPARLRHLASCAEALGSPLVSEHVAFVRAGGTEAGHLLPVPRTREALEVLVANVRIAQSALPVPLALENVAALLDWPDPELTEARFLSELLDRTGAWLLLDVANLYANARNGGYDPVPVLDTLPLDRVAYVHVAGGVERGGLYHDTHAHPVPPAVLDLVRELCHRRLPPGLLLERDDAFPSDAELIAELAALAGASEPAAPSQPAAEDEPAAPSQPAAVSEPAAPSRPAAVSQPAAEGEPARRGRAHRRRRPSDRAGAVTAAPDPAFAPDPVFAPDLDAAPARDDVPASDPAPDPGKAPDAAGLRAARERLAAAQYSLVNALVAGASPPPGFAPERVAAAAEALLRKRIHEIAAAWPGLALGMGAAFANRAAVVLAGRPPAGTLTDGWLVARALHAADLPPDGAAELAAIEAAYRLRDGRLVPRRGASAAITRVRAAGAIVLTVRVGAFARTVTLRRRTR